MKQTLLMILFFTALKSFSQDTTTIIKDTLIEGKDAIVFSNGKLVVEGQKIKCGRGTMTNGDFKFIFISRTAMVNGGLAIGRSYSGLMLDVKKVSKVGNKKRGYKYLIKVGGGNIVNYECEIADAVAVGEIILQ